jgi:hypothetical protein
MWIAPALAASFLFPAWEAKADQLNCSLAEYRALPGLTAAVAGNTLIVTWEGSGNQELRLRLGIDGGALLIEELAARRNGGTWVALAVNAKPDIRVVSRLRRITAERRLQPGLAAPLGGKMEPVSRRNQRTSPSQPHRSQSERRS